MAHYHMRAQRLPVQQAEATRPRGREGGAADSGECLSGDVRRVGRHLCGCGNGANESVIRRPLLPHRERIPRSFQA